MIEHRLALDETKDFLEESLATKVPNWQLCSFRACGRLQALQFPQLCSFRGCKLLPRTWPYFFSSCVRRKATRSCACMHHFKRTPASFQDAASGGYQGGWRSRCSSKRTPVLVFQQAETLLTGSTLSELAAHPHAEGGSSSSVATSSSSAAAAEGGYLARAQGGGSRGLGGRKGGKRSALCKGKPGKGTPWFVIGSVAELERVVDAFNRKTHPLPVLRVTHSCRRPTTSRPYPSLFVGSFRATGCLSARGKEDTERLPGDPKEARIRTPARKEGGRRIRRRPGRRIILPLLSVVDTTQQKEQLKTW